VHTAFDASVTSAIRQSFLAGVPQDVVDQLVTNAVLMQVSAGQILIRASEKQTCGVIVSGLARVYLQREDGRQVTMRRIGVGASEGITALAAGHNPVSVQAITDCIFLRLQAGRLVTIARSDPRLGWAIAEELTRRLEDTCHEFMNAASGSVRQRVARCLLDRAAPGKRGGRLEVDLTQEALAEAIGAARESVGEELRRFSAHHVVELARGRVLLHDTIKLHRAARDFRA
jgi:CRP/FNR family cyclic AMP-dependent transcriptional regulator